MSDNPATKDSPSRGAHFCNTVTEASPPNLTFGSKSKIPRVTGSQVCKWQPCATSKSKRNCFAFHWQRKSNFSISFNICWTSKIYPGPKGKAYVCVYVGKVDLLCYWCGGVGVRSIYNLVIFEENLQVYRYYLFSMNNTPEAACLRSFKKMRCRSILSQYRELHSFCFTWSSII